MASDVKWIKIMVDIFDDEKIFMLEQFPEADGIIVIWFKLLCLAGKQNNSGVFVINDTIPYTDEMFSAVFRRPLNLVRLALSTFEKFGMVKIVNGTVTIPKWGKYQSLDKLGKRTEYMRGYMADYREKQKMLTAVNSLRKANVSVLEEEGDKDKDIEIENKNTTEGGNLPPTTSKEDKKSACKTFSPPSVEDVKAYCLERNNCVDAQMFCDFYASKGWYVGKNPMKDWKAAVRTWETRKKADSSQAKAYSPAKRVVEQQYSQRYYDPAEYDGPSAEEIEEARKL